MKNKLNLDNWWEQEVKLPKDHIGIINSSVVEILQMTIDFCLICSNCDRKMPNKKFRKGKGCKWCMK